jgi:putative transport protein
MEIDIYDLLYKNQVLLIFVLIGLGYLLGRVKLFGYEIGSITGVLLVSLFFGAYEFPIAPYASTFGFSIFIFCVGIQAGPSFFRVFAEDGSRYLVLSLIVAVSGATSALLIVSMFDMDFGFGAGILAGALTSTPTLVGAQDAVNSGIAALPNGISKENAIQNISVAYSLTYLFGMGGLMIFIHLIPKLFKVDLAKEARKISSKLKSTNFDYNEDNLPIIRVYQITSDKLAGQTIENLQDSAKQDFKILAIKRKKDLIEAERNTVLEKGDVVSVIAAISQHSAVDSASLGEEVFDKELLNYHIKSEEVIVTDPSAVGKNLGDLELASHFGCYVRQVIRSGVTLPADPKMVLSKGDRLNVMGETDLIKKLGEKIGRIESHIEETDLLTFAAGITAGLLLGSIVFKFGNINIGLGSAGGLLFAGILIGFIRSVHPTFGVFPSAARNILMEFGIALFMASIGLNAGAGVLDALASSGYILIICGVVTMCIPVLIAYLFGTYVLKFNQALLLGAITGAMTSSSSLNIVTTAAKSHVPALAYAGTYTFANVFLTFAGTLLISLQ